MKQEFRSPAVCCQRNEHTARGESARFGLWDRVGEQLGIAGGPELPRLDTKAVSDAAVVLTATLFEEWYDECPVLTSPAGASL